MAKQYKLYSSHPFHIEIFPEQTEDTGMCCLCPKTQRLDWIGKVISRGSVLGNLGALELEGLDVRPRSMDQRIVFELKYVGYPSVKISKDLLEEKE